MKINMMHSYIYCIIFFASVDEYFSSSFQCLKNVQFFDQVSFSWHQCSICSEPGGTQFNWQCKRCCTEITTPGPNGTSTPGTLPTSPTPKKIELSSLSPISHDVFTSTTPSPSVPTTSKQLTNVEIGLTVTVCVIAAVAFILGIILIVLKKPKIIGTSSCCRMSAANEYGAGNTMEPEENQPIQCSDNETTNQASLLYEPDTPRILPVNS